MGMPELRWSARLGQEEYRPQDVQKVRSVRPSELRGEAYAPVR